MLRKVCECVCVHMHLYIDAVQLDAKEIVIFPFLELS